MKRFFAAILIFTMTAASFHMSAMAEEGTARISFCIGEETLMINGESVTVEKPYVVGEGVTLVPLRVITEAFGATVEWIDEIKTVNIEYPDVKITLEINNPTAEVNGKAEKLLSAPELKNGTTMVPLRFIAETLGAEVGYDAETGQITVTKSKTEAGTTVEGGISNAYVGDSYYGWSIENAAKMTIESRSYDGEFTAFTLDYNNFFYIQVEEIPEEYDFEEDFETSMQNTRGSTLVKSEKTEQNGIKKIHIQSRNKLYFNNSIRIITDKYRFSLYGSFDNTNSSVKNELIRIMSTFKSEYIQGDIYDLSEIKEEWRSFEAESMNLSIEMPSSYEMVSDANNDTEHTFSSVNPADKDANIALAIYSKSSVTGAKELAEADLAQNKTVINEDISTFSEVTDGDYGSISVYEYTYEIDERYRKTFTKDVFFEKGDYVYNVMIRVPIDKENKDEFISKVLGSIKVSEPDSEVLGPVLKNRLQPREGTKQATVEKAVLTIPKTYVNLADIGEAFYANFTSGASVSVKVVSAESGNGRQSATEYVQRLEKEVKEDENASVTKATSTAPMGANSVTSIHWEETKDEIVTFNEIYAIEKDSKIYVIETSCTEVNYTKTVRNDIKGIVSSVYFK